MVALLVAGWTSLHGEVEVTFGPARDGAETVMASGVWTGDGTLATVAVVGANPQDARLSSGDEASSLTLLGHDPVTRLTILKGSGRGATGELKRGQSLEIEPGAALYRNPGAEGSPSRVVGWESSYQGKILPVALLRVHHPGDSLPRPGTPLFNADGELVALCHQPAPNFGNGTFALPVEVLARVEADLEVRDAVAPCWIGITVDASSPVLAIEMVRPESPGGKAGLRKGDILLKIGPRTVRTYADARNAFYYLVSGQKTPVEVLRGTQKLTLQVIPEVHPTVELDE